MSRNLSGVSDVVLAFLWAWKAHLHHETVMSCSCSEPSSWRMRRAESQSYQYYVADVDMTPPMSSPVSATIHGRSKR